MPCGPIGFGLDTRLDAFGGSIVGDALGNTGY